MAFLPQEPFPKTAGDEIRAGDWNDTVDALLALEQRIQALEQDRVKKSGDAIAGSLTVGGRLGVGTTTIPNDALEVNGALRFNGNAGRRIYGDSRGGENTVVVGGGVGELEIQGRIIDWSAGNLLIGFQNDHSAHEIHIGRRVRSTHIFSGNPMGQTLSVTDDRVGIGTAAPVVKVHVIGDRVRLQKPGTAQTLDLRADGAALDIETQNADLYLNSNNRPVRIRNLVQGSSRDWKEDIGALGADEAGRLLADLEPQSFRFRDDPDGRRHLGFVAQDLPAPIATPEREGFNPTAVIAVLTRVVKEQQQAIAALRGELTALRADFAGSASPPLSEQN